MNNRRIVAIISLLMFLPTASVLAAGRAAQIEEAAARHGVVRPASIAGSDGRSVALISVPFLAAGLAVMIGYRKSVAIYQDWHRQKEAFRQRLDRPGPAVGCPPLDLSGLEPGERA